MTVELGDGGAILGAGGSARDHENSLDTDVLTPAVPEEALQRSHSTSAIEHLFHHSQAPAEHRESPRRSRSSSCDDLAPLSGPVAPILTPTKARFRL